MHIPRLMIAGLLALGLGLPVAAQQAQAPERPAAPEPAGDRLPAAVTTRHEVALPGGALGFAATAGAVVLTGADRSAGGGAGVRRLHAAGGRPGAAAGDVPGQRRAGRGVGVSQHRRDRAVAAADGRRPDRAVAGGWSWRRTPRPGSPFTDLVFVDPVGTGFSRLIEPDDRLRGRYLSIDGDVEALADFIRQWLTEHGRIARRRRWSARATAGFAGR